MLEAPAISIPRVVDTPSRSRREIAARTAWLTGAASGFASAEARLEHPDPPTRRRGVDIERLRISARAAGRRRGHRKRILRVVADDASSSFATSRTVRPIGPGVSWKCTSGEKPARLIRPVVTRSPYRLLNEAGSGPTPRCPRRPHQSEVGCYSHGRPRTGTARLTCSAYGFLVWSVIEENENQPAAKSHIAVLARITAPASLSLVTIVASDSGT